MADREQEIRARLAAATPGPWTISASNYMLVFTGSDPWAISHGQRFIAAAEQSVEDAELIANAPADLAYLLDENQRLREVAVRVVDNHEAIQAARPVEGAPLNVAHWIEIERLKVALGHPGFDVDGAMAGLERVMLVRLAQVSQERDDARESRDLLDAEMEQMQTDRDQARADLAAAREELTDQQQGHEQEARAYQAAIDETNALLAAARAEVERLRKLSSELTGQVTQWSGAHAEAPRELEVSDRERDVLLTDLDQARDLATRAAEEAARLREALEELWGSLHETDNGELFEDFNEERWARFNAAYAQAGAALAREDGA